MRGATTTIITALVTTIPLAVGCVGDPAEDPESLRVSGVVRDFQSGAPIAGSVSVTTRGLEPQPLVTVAGAEYALDQVTPHSVFHLLAGAAGTHRATYGEAIEVTTQDRWNVDVHVVSEAYLASLVDGFGVTPSASRGFLLARAVDDAGRPRAGVPARAFAVPPGAAGPYVLDDQLRPAPAALATSASGWVVFFDVAPGVVGLAAAPDENVTMEMALAPVSPTSATIATVTVRDGEIALPRDVSFTNDVLPIFSLRGCIGCHSGGGPGKDLGGLQLDGGVPKVFRELTQEAALTAGAALRVNLAAPEQSLVLTMPSAEDPPDRHPNITFRGPLDPDYLTILVWIREGARQN